MDSRHEKERLGSFGVLSVSRPASTYQPRRQSNSAPMPAWRVQLRTIARLERKLGVRLFERVGRSVVLTKKGRSFLPIVDRAYGEIEEAEGLFRYVGNQRSGSRQYRIRLLTDVQRLSFVPQDSSAIQRAIPEDEFSFSETTPPQSKSSWKRVTWTSYLLLYLRAALRWLGKSCLIKSWF